MKSGTQRILAACCFAALALVFLTISPATCAEPAVKEWRVPSLIFLTGPFAGFGKQIRWGTDEAAAEINAAGGIAGKPLVIDWYDTGNDPAKSAAEMSKVVKSLLIFGPVGASSCKGALPLVVREKGFAMPVDSGADVVSEFFPYTLHNSDKFEKVTPPPTQGWAKRNPQMKTVVQFVFPFDQTFMDVAKFQARTLEAQGIKVLPNVEISESVDLASAVIRAMAQKPDGFTIVTLPPDAAKIVKELDKRGVKDKSRIFTFPVVDDPSFYELGKGYIDGMYVWHFVNVRSQAPRWKALYGKYRKAFPEFKEPTFGMVCHYDMVYMAKAAIEKTGATGNPAKLVEERDRIREYCRNVKDFPGVQYTFDMVDGLGKTPTFLFRVENDEKVLVETYPAAK
jgi:branched-chain amino acid transport system substrate-binding protein